MRGSPVFVLAALERRQVLRTIPLRHWPRGKSPVTQATEQPQVFDVLDDDGNVLVTLCPEKSDCRPYEPNDACGGCDNCLLAQATHYEYTIKRRAEPCQVK